MNSLWFRDIYKKPIMRGEIDRTLRYGNRTINDNGKLAYHAGEIILIKFIKTPYSQDTPVFDNDELTAKIKSLYITMFRDLKKSQLVKSDFQGIGLRKVIEDLERLYKQKVNEKDICTILEFEILNTSQI